MVILEDDHEVIKSLYDPAEEDQQGTLLPGTVVAISDYTKTTPESFAEEIKQGLANAVKVADQSLKNQAAGSLAPAEKEKI